MNVFNSLGSNYTFGFVLRSLFSWNDTSYKVNLKNYLENRFGGKVVFTYKGREAIELALKTLELPKDSWIVICGFTCYAVYKPIENSGASVEFLDIDDSLNFAPDNLKIILDSNPKVKAVIVQNTLGNPCEIEKIEELCKESGAILIEDLAHSVGTIYEDGREAGTVGDFTILSFSQDKIIDGISGGALVVRNDKYGKDLPSGLANLNSKQQLKDRFYPLFTFLIRSTYQIGVGKFLHWFLKTFGMLSQPMDYSNEQVKNLPPWYCNLTHSAFIDHENNINHRKIIARIYAENLDKKLMSDKVKKNISLSSNLRFPIFVENRKDLINLLRENGVYISDIWYDAPVAPRKYLGMTSYNDQYPEAEKISEKIINLPTHINVSEDQAREIAQLINKWQK